MAPEPSRDILLRFSSRMGGRSPVDWRLRPEARTSSGGSAGARSIGLAKSESCSDGLAGVRRRGSGGSGFGFEILVCPRRPCVDLVCRGRTTPIVADRYMSVLYILCDVQ